MPSPYLRLTAVFFGFSSLFLLAAGCQVERPEMYPEEPEEAVVQVPAKDAGRPVEIKDEEEGAERKNGEKKAAAKGEAAPKENGKKEDDSTLSVAKVGDGRQGRYGDPTGGPADFIAVPISAMFRSKQRVVFEIQIPQAMQLYKANNDDKAPASHEAFMKDIIEYNRIPLPPLPDGEEYVYDPVSEQLMVKRPKQSK